MSSGVKTLLWVGGAAAATFTALAVFAPKPVAARPQTNRTTPISIAGIGGFFSSVGDLFSSRPTQFRDVQDPSAAYASAHDVLEVDGNQLIDLNTGRPVEYGAY